MQIRLLVIIFSCLTFIILFVLIYNYTRATQTDLPNFAPYQLYSDSQSDTQIAEMSQWINKMSSQEQTPFVYPASMLNVKLIFEEDLSRDKHQEIFQVLVGKVDDYQFFCINQVLTANRINYSYYKVGDNIWLAVVTKNELYLRNVLDRLKHYSINYTLIKS